MDIELDKECLLKYKSLIRTCHFLDKTNCLHPCYFDPMQTHLKILFSICTFKFRITNHHTQSSPIHETTFSKQNHKIFISQAVSQSDQNSAVCLYIYTHALFTQFTGETEVALLVTSVALYNACVRLGTGILGNVKVDFNL